MPNYTTNLNLEKPLASEQYNIDVFNANADKIDAFAGQIPARALTADKLTVARKINGVNFKGDSDITLPTVNISGNQTVEGVKTFSNIIQGTIANAQNATNDGNGDKIDETYIKTADLADKWHALKGYSDEGELLNDDEGLDDVRNYAHSTYDSTKFTITGSPTITSDGVLTSTSSGNYVQIQNFYLGSDCEFIMPANWSSLTGARLCGINSASTFMMFLDNTGKMTLDVGDGTNWVVQETGTHTFAINTNYLFKLTYGGATYRVFYSTDNGATWTKDIEVASSQSIPSGTLNIASNRSLSTFASGSFDLKQISLKRQYSSYVVFVGNKTGIDTIKDDNYTIVGTGVTVTNGIASGFTSSSYITGKKTLNLTKAYDFYIKCHTPVSWNNSYESLTGQSTIAIRNFNGVWNVDLGGMSITGTHTIALDTDYTLRVSYNGANGYSLYVNGALEGTATGTASVTSGAITYGRFNSTNTDRYWTGTIDLSNTYFVQAGAIVDYPILTVPYTWSKTGSKIVDSVYRNRVNETANQLGYALYYTLSDTDFTLPQGEIYGMMQGLKTNIPLSIIPDYSRAIAVNYTSGEAVGFDGWLAINIHPAAAGGFYVAINNVIVCQNDWGNGGDFAANVVLVKSTDIITYSNLNFTAGLLPVSIFLKMPFTGGN